MSHGLRVWDASGSQILTITDRITRFISSSVVFVGGTVNIPVPGLVLDGTWFVYASTSNSIANFTCTVNVGSVTLQQIGSYQGTVNLLVFRA